MNPGHISLTKGMKLVFATSRALAWSSDLRSRYKRSRSTSGMAASMALLILRLLTGWLTK
jgi:uncharacterized protein (AIM24 family)